VVVEAAVGAVAAQVVLEMLMDLPLHSAQATRSQLAQVALAVDRPRRKELPDQIPFLVQSLLLVAAEVGETHRATVKMAVRGVAQVTAVVLAPLEMATLHQHRHRRETTAAITTQAKTMVEAVAVLAR